MSAPSEGTLVAAVVVTLKTPAVVGVSQVGDETATARGAATALIVLVFLVFL